MKLAGLALSLIAISTAAIAAESKTKSLWFEDCSRCHAADGSGNCPLGKSLKVRDYTSKKAQSEFSDNDIEKLIKEGKVRDNKKVMPAYTLDQNEIRDMMQFIRALAKN